MTKEEMSKDEILRNRVGLIPYLSLDKSLGQIYIAMDEYAKQQAIAFGEWVDVNAVRNGFHVWTVGCGESKKDYTSEQLYNKFIEQQNSK